MLGELDMLKTALTSMAMLPLAAYHEEMQHNVDQATSDLRETLEQMEIQNVERIWRKNAPRKRRALNLNSWQICRTSCARR